MPSRPGDELLPCRGPGLAVDEGRLNGSYRLLSGASSSPFESPNGRRDMAVLPYRLAERERTDRGPSPPLFSQSRAPNSNRTRSAGFASRPCHIQRYHGQSRDQFFQAFERTPSAGEWYVKMYLRALRRSDTTASYRCKLECYVKKGNHLRSYTRNSRYAATVRSRPRWRSHPA